MKKLVSLSLILLTVLLGLCGCKKGGVEDGFSSYSFFGTFLQVYLYCDDEGQEAQKRLSDAKNAMLQDLQMVQNALDTQLADSDVARFNDADAGEKVQVSKITADCFLLAQKVYNATNGAYNPAVYNLVDLWGFSARVLNGNSDVVEDYDREFPSAPDEQYVEAFRQLTNFDDVKLDFDGEKYFLTKPNATQNVNGVEYTLKVDFGGICKGFASDRLEQIAQDFGITKGYFSVGQSSIKFLNSADGKGYDVDVENPLSVNTVLLTKEGLKNQSISVSGDYQRFFEQDGKKYCHIIDAKTGRAVDTGVNAVFAVCDQASVCDAITTALMTLPKEQLVRLSQSQALKDLGVNSVVIVDTAKEGNANVYTNARDVKMRDENAKRYGFVCNEDSVEFFVVNDYEWGWIAFVLVAIALLIVGVVANKRKVAQGENLNTKFFIGGDLVVYLVLALVVAGAFFGTQIGFRREELLCVQVYCQDTFVLTYDCETMTVEEVSAEWQDLLDITSTQKSTVVTIFLNEEKTEYNVIEFVGGQAKMIGSTCFGKDCVKTASTVNRANQLVLCLPHGVKLVGVGVGNKGVR